MNSKLWPETFRAVSSRFELGSAALNMYSKHGRYYIS